MEKQNRRRKIIYIPQDQLLSFFFFTNRQPMQFYRVPMAEGLPPDFDVLAVHHDYERASFAFIISHESFDEVGLGERYPVVQVNWSIVELDLKKRMDADETPGV